MKIDSFISVPTQTCFLRFAVTNQKYSDVLNTKELAGRVFASIQCL